MTKRGRRSLIPELLWTSIPVFSLSLLTDSGRTKLESIAMGRNKYLYRAKLTILAPFVPNCSLLLLTCNNYVFIRIHWYILKNILLYSNKYEIDIYKNKYLLQRIARIKKVKYLSIRTQTFRSNKVLFISLTPQTQYNYCLSITPVPGGSTPNLT